MLDETVHVRRVQGAAVAVVEIVAAVTIEGSTEASSLGVVQTGTTDRQAHAPVSNVGPDEGSRGEEDLRGTAQSAGGGAIQLELLPTVQSQASEHGF